MKLLGILLAVLGGVLKMLDPYHLNLVSDGAPPTTITFANGIGIVPPAIFAVAIFAHFGNGHIAGIALMFVSLSAIFLDGGLLIALPFVGSLMILWAANTQTSTPNS